MAAAVMVQRAAVSYGHRYLHPSNSRVSARKEGSRFNLIIRLPDGTMTRIKRIKDTTSVAHVKNKLELVSGFCAPTYTLYHVDGVALGDDDQFRLNDNVKDNDILRLSPLQPFSDVYWSLAEDDNSNVLKDILQEGIDTSQAFYILFMASYYGYTGVCERILSSHHVKVSQSTAAGNTCLHAAAVSDRVTTALYLCERGAELHQKNQSGETPLDVALQSGSFTCERQLRLSQWSRRKARLPQETEYTKVPTVGVAPTPCRDSYVQNHWTSNTVDCVSNDTVESSLSNNLLVNQKPAEQTLTNPKEVELSSTNQPSECAHKDMSRPPTRPKSSAVNHAMPMSAVKKRKERIARAKSAPALNSESKNYRLCTKTSIKKPHQLEQSKQESRQPFAVRRPQYLQFIKSSTGIVEEDYFADIFPNQDVDERPKDRSFNDQMKRNERIFKNMFKQSGAVHDLSDTDSEEEREREHANDKAFKIWSKKKKLHEEAERGKQSLVPSQPLDKKTQGECLGELLMIGDTSLGQLTPTNPDLYLTAYQTHRQSTRYSSAASTKSRTVNDLDPLTYEEWVDRRPIAQNIESQGGTKPQSNTINKRQLTKHIDYKTWLNEANKRISKQVKLQRKEEKHKRDFEVWINELKEEVGTYDYWKRRKDEQLAKERQTRLRKQEEQKRKTADAAAKKRELAKDIYKHWSTSKDMKTIEQEEKRLQQEIDRLNKLKPKSR